MPKLINKTKPDNYVTTSRSLLRDKRLKPASKLIYSLLHNLAKSCDNVFPFHTWIAENIGYDNEGKTEEATRQYVIRHLKPLLHLGLIKAVYTQGVGYDYEIYDYDPQEKPWDPPKKNLGGTPKKNLGSIYYIGKEIEKEKGEEQTPENFSEKTQTPNPPSKKEISDTLDKVLQKAGIGLDEPLAYSIFTAVNNLIPATKTLAYLQYLLEIESQKTDFHERKTKSGVFVKYEIRAYSDWFYKSFLSWEATRKRQGLTEESKTIEKQKTKDFFEEYYTEQASVTEEQKLEAAKTLEEVRQNLKKNVFNKIKSDA